MWGFQEVFRKFICPFFHHAAQNMDVMASALSTISDHKDKTRPEGWQGAVEYFELWWRWINVIIISSEAFKIFWKWLLIAIWPFMFEHRWEFFFSHRESKGNLNQQMIPQPPSSPKPSKAVKTCLQEVSFKKTRFLTWIDPKNVIILHKITWQQHTLRERFTFAQ